MPVGLALTALFFLVMGIAALVAPARILAPFGVKVATADGRSEVRAVYGGFGVVTAALLVLSVRVPHLRDGILVGTAAAMIGMAAGRLASAAADRTIGAFPALFFVVELAIAGTLVAVALGVA